MWAEHALDAWSTLERDAIRRRGRSVHVLEGPGGRRAPLWPIAQVIWAAAEITSLGSTPPLDDLPASIAPYRSGEAYAATPRGRRYYDDNAWLGLAMLRLDAAADRPELREQAEQLASFVQQGEHPDGGVRWAEGSESRNVCSTASSAWLLMSTGAGPGTAGRWMRWLDDRLLGEDGLYADRIENRAIDPRRWTYNQGAALAARRALGWPTEQLRGAILDRWPPERLWSEPPAFAAIAYRALREEHGAHDQIDATWDPYLERLTAEARDPRSGWYVSGGVGSYDGSPTIDQAAVIQMLAFRAGG
jgi:glycosyl hydrolase family 76